MSKEKKMKVLDTVPFCDTCVQMLIDEEEVKEHKDLGHSIGVMATVEIPQDPIVTWRKLKKEKGELE